METLFCVKQASKQVNIVVNKKAKARRELSHYRKKKKKQHNKVVAQSGCWAHFQRLRSKGFF